MDSRVVSGLLALLVSLNKEEKHQDGAQASSLSCGLGGLSGFVPLTSIVASAWPAGYIQGSKLIRSDCPQVQLYSCYYIAPPFLT